MRNSHFRIRLFFIMIVFALVISTVGAMISYYKLRQHVMESHQFQLEHIEESVESSLKSIEKVYYFFDKDTEERMEANSQYLLELYAKNQNFNTWDFQELEEIFNMDVYILNHKNVVIHTSLTEDLGLDFEACCPKFSKTLHERRESGKFYSDGVDISQNTGQIKKFSYIGTPDKKYLFELGYALQDGEVFQQFDFLMAIEQLVEKYPSIDDIHVINPGGYFFGEHVSNIELSDDRKKAFEKALKTGDTTEIKFEKGKDRTVYRYVPYVSDYDQGTSQRKVIEITYNEKELDALLDKTRQSFMLQLVAIIIVTIIIASLISKWVSRPMYLAYHDSLTGLKNRAAYEELLQEKRNEDDMLAYLLLDLDNFKAINDTYGHDVGDEKLKKTAHVLKQFEQEGDEIFRLGGDEFVIIIPSTTIHETERRAKQLIERMNRAFYNSTKQKNEPQLSLSIGIAFAPKHGDNYDELYKKADIALYTSKEKGKNQYWIYDEEQA